MNLSVAIVGGSELVVNLGKLPASVHAALVAKVTQLSLMLQGYIQQAKLSGQVLHVVTGALRRSIHALPVQEQGDVVIGSVASSGDVKYAGIHEFGGKTSPHDIVPRKADALHFVIGGKDVFAKIVHHPGSTMPERSYMRTGLADQAEEIAAQMKEAVLMGVTEAIG